MGFYPYPCGICGCEVVWCTLDFPTPYEGPFKKLDCCARQSVLDANAKRWVLEFFHRTFETGVDTETANDVMIRICESKPRNPEKRDQCVQWVKDKTRAIRLHSMR